MISYTFLKRLIKRQFHKLLRMSNRHLLSLCIVC